jgi:hypothetical protein
MNKGAELAESYNTKRYKDWSHDEKIADIKKYVCLANAGIGAMAALPGVGLATALPAGMLASLASQITLASAMAKVKGFDAREDLRAQILVMSMLAGDGATEALGKVGVQASKKGLTYMIKKIPGTALYKINHIFTPLIGKKLLVKGGASGVFNLLRMVPFAGMLVGGLTDGGMCLMVSSGMEKMFIPQDAQKQALMDLLYRYKFNRDEVHHVTETCKFHDFDELCLLEIKDLAAVLNFKSEEEWAPGRLLKMHRMLRSSQECHRVVRPDDDEHDEHTKHDEHDKHDDEHDDEYDEHDVRDKHTHVHDEHINHASDGSDGEVEVPFLQLPELLDGHHQELLPVVSEDSFVVTVVDEL